MALRTFLQSFIIFIILYNFVSSIECPYKCLKCQYEGNLVQKKLICLECSQNYLLSNDNTYCQSICDDDRYYLDLADLMFYQNFNMGLSTKIKTFDCVPSCDFKLQYADQKTKSCIIMNQCPYINQYGVNFQSDLEIQQIKFSKQQNLLVAYFISSSYIRLWQLDNGDYLGEISVTYSSPNSQTPQTDKLNALFFGDEIILNENMKDKQALIGLSAKNIYVWDTKIGSLIFSQNTGDTNTNIIFHYFFKEKQYVFLLNSQSLEIYLYKLNKNQTLFIGFTQFYSFIRYVYNQYSNELACLGFNDKNSLILQVFFLDQDFLVGVFSKLIYLKEIELVSKLFAVGKNLYLIMFRHVPYLLNSENETIKLIEMPLFSSITNIQLPFEDAINSIKLEVANLKRGDGNEINIAILQQKSDMTQSSIAVNLFQDNKYERVIEILPQGSIYNVQIMNDFILDDNLIRLFCMNDLLTQIFIYEIDIKRKILVNTYVSDQTFPIITATLFITGFWEEKELVFYNSQLILLGQIQDKSQSELHLEIKFEIRNYNQAHFIDYNVQKNNKITKMYEDIDNNYLVSLNQILQEIKIVDLNKQEQIGRIVIKEKTNCLPIDFVVISILNVKFILVLCDNCFIYMYDYNQFQYVISHQFYDFDLNSIQDFSFVESFTEQGSVIIFSSTIIIRINLSSDGQITSQFQNQSFDKVFIKDIAYFPENLNSPKILYVISSSEFSVYQLNPETLELYSDRTQYKGDELFLILSYYIDYQNCKYLLILK